MVADKHFLVVEQHTIDSLYSGTGSLAGRVVDETATESLMGTTIAPKGSRETTRLSGLIGANLAREDITKSRKSVMQSLRGD